MILEIVCPLILNAGETYRRPGKTHHMPFLLELTELEANFYNSREDLLGPLVVKEVPLLLHQDQDTVIV